MDREVCGQCGSWLGDNTQAKILKQATELKRLRDENSRLVEKNSAMEDALRLIASPKRKDGTWNRDRDACYELAKEALKQ